jgi:signal recognition particle subunit SRP19
LRARSEVRQRYFKEGREGRGYMPDKSKIVIWPIYFDAARSRDEGRMISREYAINEPNLDMIITASIKSGLKPEIEREKKHPKTWHKPEAAGRILVAKKGSKSATLKKIAGSLKMKYKKQATGKRG